MAMSQKMGLKMGLGMQLRMTPQLQQAIKLLQLSRLELEQEVRKELEDNPVLEEFADGPDEITNPGVQAEANENTEQSREQQDPQKQDEINWDEYFDATYKPMPNMSGGNEEIMNYENLITTPQSLYDHLMWQMRNSGFSDEEQTLAGILIGYVDDDGYITVPISQIAEDEGIDAANLESVLPYVQEFDPPGVGARDLQECLIIQARHVQEDTKDVVSLIKNHFKDLEKRNFAGIAKALNTSVEDVAEMAKLIYSMDPKPGRAFIQPDTHYVQPDVFVYKVGDEYMVSLNEDGLPRLRISNFYRNLLAGKSQKGETQDFVTKKLQSAVWLIKSIHQRQRTIYKVSESIVKRQREFFDKGPSFLRPMILRDVADDIGMHESTVSRVTTSKYMHTPQGIFELKHFFNSGIGTDDGEALASESVKVKIKELIVAEDTKDPLSDQQIVEMLKREGINIARRTVAKYRESLKILPSSRRKKYF
ncbi:MAG: RNA polymerase factor sigma-54 [Deltaproteobacteria bacterium]|nr:RNA polymerase factor sigma-54 [Deltaproteobacteria bacterium]